MQRVNGIDQYGLRTGFAFPIRLNREVLGVIAMFSRRVQPPDKHLLRLLHDICSQIGQVMGRRRAERRLLDVSEREQQRIGQDLHDGLCQQLAGIAYMASDLESKLKKADRSETQIAKRISELSRETATQARQIARGLNPVKLGTGGLTAALDALATSIHTMFSVKCRFVCREGILIQDHETAIHLYRIAQESIHNAITHGQATDIVVTLVRDQKKLVLRITNNGHDLAGGHLDSAGMGVENMNYRARAIGATLRFTARPGGGTVTDCRFTQPQGRLT
jgi:signal transduction histidine kinase